MKATRPNTRNWIQIILCLVLGTTFFLNWVNWDGNLLAGCSMPSGHFFEVAESQFALSNPFPKLSFLFYVFSLIPILSLVTIILIIFTKNKPLLSFIAASMALALVTIFILFSGILVDLGAGASVTAMLKPVIYIHALSAVALILTAFPVRNQVWRIFWLLIGPVIAFASFKMVEKYVLGETHSETTKLKPDFTVDAQALISEFLANDTAANKKYNEKIILVNGDVSAVEMLADSSSTIKFADTTGSYAIFSFEKNEADKVRNIQQGQRVSLKGVCSGSIYSEILGTTSISFKRSMINK